MRGVWETRIPAAQSAVSRGGEAALRAAALHVQAESNRTVPLDEGTLMRSSGVDVMGDKATVFYNTVYARRQHEELGWRHDPGRRAKYLELAGREQGRAAAQIAQTILRGFMS